MILQVFSSLNDSMIVKHTVKSNTQTGQQSQSEGKVRLSSGSMEKILTGEVHIELVHTGRLQRQVSAETSQLKQVSGHLSQIFPCSWKGKKTHVD